MEGAEIWKPIPGFAFYEASNHGRIRNGKTGHVKSTRKHVARGEKIYLKVTLKNGSKNGTTHLVHRLVCMAFHGVPKDDRKACHKDDDGMNNRADNLEWGSQFHNMRQRFHRGQEEIRLPKIGEVGDAWEPEYRTSA